MKLFFVDDSYQSLGGLYGQGGVIIDEEHLRPLLEDFDKLKNKFKIPGIELKWSPDKEHYLRKKFTGDRCALYKAAIGLLAKHDVVCACAVHLLPECHGIKLHGWTIPDAKKWASEQQIVWLAERFQSPFLEGSDSRGMIILDSTSQHDDREMARSFAFDLQHGTRYHKLSRITLNLLSADSALTSPLQFADLVIGVTVSWLGGGKYAEPLFPLLFNRFVHSDHGNKSTVMAALPSAIISGYGLKIFPRELQAIGRERFKKIDAEYTYTSKHGFVAN